MALEYCPIDTHHQVSIQTTIQDVDADDWNRMAAGNAFASHGWLLTCERCWLAIFKPRYFVLRIDGQPAGVAACYWVKKGSLVETLDHLLLGRLHWFADIAGISFLPALVCGPPVPGYGWHIGVDMDLNKRDRNVAYKEMLDAIETEADHLGVALSFALVLNSEHELCDLLASRGYMSSRNIPAAIMDVSWSSMDEYFARLPNKRRREFRRQRRRNLDAGVRIELLRNSESRDMHELFLALLDRHARRCGSPGLPFGKGFIEELRENMDDQALLFVARKGSAIGGVYLALRRGDSVVAFAVAIDPEVSGNDFTYFELVYNTMIEYAIEDGVERILFGRGLYEVKLRRGCRFVDTMIFTRPNGMLRAPQRWWYCFASLWNHYKLKPRIRRHLASPSRPACFSRFKRNASP
jgi:predicted N-acyltransferase